MSVVALMLFAACDSRHAAQPADSDADTTITEAIADSSVYGIVGEGTAMHTLEVITDVGDTLELCLLMPTLMCLQFLVVFWLATVCL